MTIEDDFFNAFKNCIEIVKKIKNQDKELWFHGTNKESAKCILEEGFKCLKELDSRFNLGKGLTGESDLIWFTKEPAEACHHITYSPRGAKPEAGYVIMAKIKAKQPFILNEKVPRQVIQKAKQLAETDDRFIRAKYAISEDMFGEDFLRAISKADIERNGKYTFPTYGEILDALNLGYDSVMYKHGTGGENPFLGVFARKNKEDTIAVSHKDLIEIEGLLWNFEK